MAKTDKEKWISAKIKKYRAAGKTKAESVSMAYNQYRQENDLPKHQQLGVTSGQDVFSQYNITPFYPTGQAPVQANPSADTVFDAMTGTYKSATYRPTTNQGQFTPYNQYSQQELMAQSSAEQQTRTGINQNQIVRPQVSSVIDSNFQSQGISDIGVKPTDESEFLEQEDKDIQAQIRGQNTPQQPQQKPRIFNPFGGVSLEQSLYYAGQGFKNNRPGQAALGTGLSVLKGARTFMSGLASGQEEQRLRDEYNQNIQQEQPYTPSYNYGSYQQGGQIPPGYHVMPDGTLMKDSAHRKQKGGTTNGDMLTGQYLTDTPNQPTEELEDGEFAKNSATGQVQEVVGEKHDNGGVKTDLPGGSKVLSDFTEVGKENAKKFREKFGIKLKKNATFAEVLEKVNKKNGLTKLLEEEKEIYEKVENQSDNKDIKTNVRELNLQALQTKLQKIEEEKKDLKAEEQTAFEILFNEQEKIPKKENTSEMKEGGTVDADLDFLAAKYKIDKPRLKELIETGIKRNYQAGGETITRDLTDEEYAQMIDKNSSAMYLPKNFYENADFTNTSKDIALNLGKYKDLGYFNTTMNGEKMVVSPTERMIHTPSAYNDVIRYLQEQNPNVEIQGNYIPLESRGENVLNNNNKEVAQLKKGGKTKYQDGGFTNEERLEDFYKQAVELGYEGETDKPVKEIQKEIKKLQKFYADNYPNEILDYFTENNQPITAKGIDRIRQESPEVLEELGFATKTKSAEYSPEERRQIFAAYAGRGNITPDFILDQFVDGVWNLNNEDTWRFPTISTTFIEKYGELPSTTISANDVELETKVSDPQMNMLGDLSKEDGDSDTPIAQKDKQRQEAESAQEQAQQMLMPDVPSQFFLPPSARQPVRMHQVQFERAEPIKTSPEQQIVEAQRQAQAAQEQAQFLSPAQRAAIAANLQVQTQAATNQAIAQTQQANTVQQAQVEAENRQIGAREQLMNIQLAQDYEDKTMRAITNQERDLRRYFNDLNQAQRFNFNYVERRNLLNQAYPNFYTTGSDVNFGNASRFFSNTQA